MLKNNAYKRLTEKIIKVPLRIQDTIPIYRIAKDGIFELESPWRKKRWWEFGKKRRKKEVHLFDRMYLFEDINFSTQDEEEKEETAKKFELLLKSMSVNFKIIISNHCSDNTKLREDIMKRAVSEQLEDLASEYQKLNEVRLEKGRNGLLQSRYFIVSCRKEDYESAKVYFETLEFSVRQLFQKMGSDLIPLNATERLRALHSFYRMGEEKEFDFNWDEYFNLRRDWRNDIINTSLREQKECLEFEEGKYGCALFVRKLPNGLSDEFMKEIINLNFPMIYTMDCEPIDNDYAYLMTMKKYMSNERSINKEQEVKNDNGDYSTNISYERRKQQRETEEMLDKLSTFDERLLYFGITILIKADSKEELKKRIERIKFIGKGKSMSIVPHSYKQLDAMNTTLPIGCRFVDTMRTITSEELSIFIPYNVQEINDEAGFSYGFNQVSKNLIIGNRKLLTNGNGMVFGDSGSGKSMQMKFEMGQVLAFTKDDIQIIDPMGEYKDISDSWGGSYVNLTQSAENKFYINPLHVPEVVLDKDGFIAEKVEFANAIVEQAIKPAPCTSRHTAIIDKALRELYNDFFEKREKMRGKKKLSLDSPTLKIMRDYIAENFDMENNEVNEIVSYLEPYTDGTMSIFSHQQSVAEKNRLTVYGFADLGSKMRSMAMLIMMETITSQIKYNQADGVSTWVYADEVHEIWGDEFALKSINRMWREVRKRGGICTGMSQNIIDAKQNNATKSIVSNSEFILLLDQGNMDKEDVRDIFDMSENQINCVSDATPGTGLIRFGNKIVPFDNRMQKDCGLYKLFNTNFHEKWGAIG